MAGCSGVLVVEDDEDFSALLLEILKLGGYAARSAGNGVEALAMLREPGYRPCLMLVDLVMPIMNGWEFLESCDSDPFLRDIPRVVMSVAGDRMRESRASAYLPKPTDMNEIMKLLETFARRQKAPLLPPMAT